MRYELTPEQIRYYREHGYVVVEDFLAEAELRDWRHAVDQAVVRRKTNQLPGNRRFSNEDARDYYTNVFTQRINLWMDNPEIKRLILDRRIGKLVADVAGVEGVRVWCDQALYKPPFGNPTAWHLDGPTWSFYSRQAMSVWLALDDVTVDNGCLWVLPGTQRTAKWETAGITENMPELFLLYPEWKKIQPVPVPLGAGGCVLLSGLVAYAAGPNMTTQPRRALSCAFMPDGSTFSGVRNILTRQQIETLQVGDVLEDENQNPLIFSRTKPVTVS